MGCTARELDGERYGDELCRAAMREDLRNAATDVGSCAEISPGERRTGPSGNGSVDGPDSSCSRWSSSGASAAGGASIVITCSVSPPLESESESAKADSDAELIIRLERSPERVLVPSPKEVRDGPWDGRRVLELVLSRRWLDRLVMARPPRMLCMPGSPCNPLLDCLRDAGLGFSSPGVSASGMGLIFRPDRTELLGPLAPSPRDDARDVVLDCSFGVGGDNWPWSIICSRAASSRLHPNQLAFCRMRRHQTDPYRHILQRIRRRGTPPGVAGVEGVLGKPANISERTSEPSPSGRIASVRSYGETRYSHTEYFFDRSIQVELAYILIFLGDFEGCRLVEF